MLKAMFALLAASMALIWVIPDEVSAQSSGARAKKSKQVVRVVKRPASVGQNGLCQRDTGTPNDKLDFRNACDVEEFWRRIIDRGSSGER